MLYFFLGGGGPNESNSAQNIIANFQCYIVQMKCHHINSFGKKERCQSKALGVFGDTSVIKLVTNLGRD